MIFDISSRRNFDVLRLPLLRVVIVTVTMCICGIEQCRLYIWFTLVLHYCNMSNLSEKYKGKNENKPCLRTFRTALVHRFYSLFVEFLLKSGK